MDKIQEKLFELLKKIDETCRANSLTYFLANETAFCAVRWGRFADNCVGAAVCMPAESYDRFEQITAANTAEHTVESIMTNNKFPFTFLHYIDKDTTRINMSIIGMQRHPGIAVKVMKLVPYTPVKNNRGLRDKIALAALLQEEAFGISAKYPKDYKEDRINELKNNAELIFEVYNSKLDTKDAGNDRYYLQQYRPTAKTFPKHIFNETTEVMFEGENFLIPGDYKNFLASIYGKNWRSRKMTFKPYSFDFIIDTETPYSMYLKTIKSVSKEAETYRKVKSEATPFAARKNESLAYLEKYNRYFDRTVDRFRLMSKYLPKKSQILAMYKKGDFRDLFFSLRDYQELCEKYIKQSIPFAFDKDFYMIMSDVFIWQGLATVHEKMEENKAEAFRYLDDASPNNSSELKGTLYSYEAEKMCLIRRSFLSKRQVALATDEELDNMHMELGLMMESSR